MTMNSEITSIMETIRDTVDCEKIYLFGSYAYGTPHEDSDYDFFVVIPDDSELRPIEVMQKVYRNLSKKNMTTPIDVIAGRSSRFAEMSALPTMERRIAREGIMLYEQSGISQTMA